MNSAGRKNRVFRPPAAAGTALAGFLGLALALPAFSQVPPPLKTTPAPSGGEAAGDPSHDGQEISPGADFPRAPDALNALRAFEEKLARGQALEVGEAAEAQRWAQDHPAPRVRAQALALLAWLPREQAEAPLIRGTDDPDPMVRVQGLVGLDVLSRRLAHGQRGAILAAAHRHLDDPSSQVACAAATVVANLAPRRANRELGAALKDADPTRAACFSRVTGLPLPAPGDEAQASREAGEGSDPGAAAINLKWTRAPRKFDRKLVWSMAGAAVGAGVLAAVPGIFESRRFFLDYAPAQTTEGRELGHPWTFVLASAGGALVGGAAGYGLALVADDGSETPALSTLAGLPVGALGGYGLGLLLGLDNQWIGLPIAGGLAISALAGLATWPLGAGPKDVAFGLGAGALSLTATSLALFTAIPLSSTTVYGSVQRLDVAVGAGLVAGALGTFSGFALGPMVSLPRQSALGIMTGGVLGMVLGMGGAYLATPLSVETRPRIAAGAGLVGELAGAVLGGLLFPTFFSSLDALPADPETDAVVAMGPGGIGLGVPRVVLTPTHTANSAKGHPEGVDLRLSLVKGRF
jgi:hypothetical protein